MNLDPSIDLIRQRLSIATKLGLESPFPPDFFEKPPQAAAVLIPFFVQDGEWNLIFIRRTEGKNDMHGGQVAFPGGRTDKGDRDPEATALRESWEEIGLESNGVQILGRLNPYHTISNYLVIPIVGVIPWPYAIRPAPQEVARAFSIPYRWLSDSDNYRKEMRKIPGQSQDHEVIYYDHYAGELLWGVTAKIVLNLITVLA